jgi:hypothetical protein
MYLASIVILMFVLPVASMGIEHFHLHGATSWTMLAGKWFVYWGAGWRLLLAGLRQYFQPHFTAREIFRMKTDEALPIIREHGIGNFAVGAAGVVSLWVPSFIVPVALIAAIFYGLAGVFHAAAKMRSMNENFVMVSDFWIAAVFAAYLIHTGV